MKERIVDLETAEGRRALLENLTDAAIRFWEAFEPLRDPQQRGDRRIDAASAYNLFSRTFVCVTNFGTPIAKPDVDAFGPIMLLLYQAVQLTGQNRLQPVFDALDTVRAKRDERRSATVAAEYGATK